MVKYIFEVFVVNLSVYMYCATLYSYLGAQWRCVLVGVLIGGYKISTVIIKG